MEFVAFSPASRYLKLPLGRVLVVAFAVGLVIFLRFYDEEGYGEDGMVGFHFGMATGLASWAILSTGPHWLRRLGIALALTVSSGLLYPYDHSDWLAIVAVIGVYSGLIFAVMAGLLLALKWFRRRRTGAPESTFQFGVKHLLWATLAVVPLALVIRAALPQFSDTDVFAVAIVGLDAILIGLITHWLLGQRGRTTAEVAGRVVISALVTAGVALILAKWPPGMPGPFDWIRYQVVVWLLLTAGYLLPRLDRYELVIRTRDDTARPLVDEARQESTSA